MEASPNAPPPDAPAQTALSGPGPLAGEAGSGPPARLHLTGVSKAYGPVQACGGVDLTVQAGEIHGLIGENGAGKSTLMKLVYGMVEGDAGTMIWDGQPVWPASPAVARRLGIGMVFQHFALFETLTVTENILLGLDPADALAADRVQLAQRIRETGERYGLELDPDRHVHDLSVGERQRVEIQRVLLQRPRLVIMDEPTSVLTPDAVQKLFGTLRQLASEGVSVLYISHKLEEVRSLCQRATVLRGGRVTGVCMPAQESVASLSRLMIGAEPPVLEAGRSDPGEVVLEVRALTLPPAEPGGRALHDCHLRVRRGEIVGVAGISGHGQNELLAALSGEDRRAAPDAIRLLGQPVGRAPVSQRRRAGLEFVPEERLGRATVPSLGLDRNLLLTRRTPDLVRAGFLRSGALRALAQSIITQLAVRAGGPTAPAASLSGGNLQKFIIGRALSAGPVLLVVAQPTWGVDVGAAADIRRRLLALRDAGAAVLVVSEELDELFEISDTLVVMQGGTLSAPVPVREATVASIGALMGGVAA